MPTKHMWRLLLGLIFVLIVSGCSSDTSSKNEEKNVTTDADGPTLSFIVNAKDLTTRSDKLLSGSYRRGMTVHELLKNSGVATFTEDASTVLSISGISLPLDMEWELQLDGTTIKDTDGDKIVKRDSNIVITAKSSDSKEPLQTVLLIVDGGNEQAQLNHSYVILFTEDLSVRSLLKSFDSVQFAEDNKTVLSVSDYIPLSNEVWKLKVNGKQLLDNGMDMKLRPQDELEILLSSH